MSLFGVEGAAAIFGDVISDGIASMQTAITQYGGAGDPGIGFPAAIRGLQAAGNAAVGVVGPAIDALGGSDPKTMTMTHRIWVKNGQLAQVRSDDSATRDDWQMAVSILTDMVNQYGVANRFAQSLHAPKPKPKPAAPAYVAPTAHAPAAAPPPPPAPAPPPVTALATTPGAGLTPETKTTIAVSTGGILGLLLGGAVGLKASAARWGLFVGGPLGGLAGAAAAWGLMKVLAPAPAEQVAVASK